MIWKTHLRRTISGDVFLIIRKCCVNRKHKDQFNAELVSESISADNAELF